jgi:hypothetical protein
MNSMRDGKLESAVLGIGVVDMVSAAQRTAGRAVVPRMGMAFGLGLGIT